VFRITVERGFSASHQLTLPDGSKESLHCHDWRVRATVSAARLDGMGLVMDFKRLSAIIDEAVSGLAGRRLEESAAFGGVNASAENVAGFVFGLVQPRLDSRVRLESIEVMETVGCWASYSSDQ
jgi:6-pyruvoyltetrahydropterin/6-carboxytetrahydropterin synthase